MTLPAIKLVNTGTNANDGTGDSIRTAFQTVNNNFSYLSTNYFVTTVTNGMVVDGTQGYRKLVLNGTGTISNVWINLPTSGSDGQEIKITSLVPITSCFVNPNNPGQPTIKWLPNNFFSSGNVTTTLTYTTQVTPSQWMTF
jgi:hypothetical protein